LGRIRACGLTVFVVVLGVLMMAPGTASAHALVQSSDPADGALLQSAPRQVVVTFTEAPDPHLSSVHVLDQGGKNVESGPSLAVPGEPRQLRVALSASLPRGVYTVTWRAVSRVDGHVTAGSFSFGVGMEPGATTSSVGGAAPPTIPPPPPLAVVGRWLFYWGLAVLLGGAAGGLLWSHGGLPQGGRVLLVAAWSVAAAGLIAMILAERSLIGVSFGSFLRSGTGRGFVERAVALAVVGLVVANGVAVLGRTTLVVLTAAVAATMLIHARAGHAAVVGSPSWFNVGVQWVHLLAVGVWVGGLPWLVLTLRRTSGEPRARAVRAYSTVAGAALGVVVLTGMSRLLDNVGWPHHWNRLFDTSFGLALVVKIGLIGGLVLLGARNRYVNVPRAGEPAGARALSRTVGLELVVVALVLAATAVMSELVPSATVAASTSRQRKPESVVAAGSDFATTVKVRLTVAPGTVGPNTFEARVVDYDTGRPVPASAVDLAFSLPGRPELGTQRLDLSKRTAGLWAGKGTVLAMEGRWSVTVTVQEPTGGVEVPLTIQTRLPPEHITVNQVPGQPTLYTIALPAGGSLQTYVDPAKAGKTNQVHFTFFTSGGGEQPIAEATATGTSPSGVSAPLSLQRLDTGHFVANEQLAAGPWRFQIQASTSDGQLLAAYFDQQIGP
jgi:copper transport protein